jgi:hypothetical protein
MAKRHCWAIMMETVFSVGSATRLYNEDPESARSPEGRWSRRKGNPVPVGLTGPPCSWGI